jgi:hypothetical protein
MAPVPSLSPPRYTLSVAARQGHEILNADVRIRDKSCPAAKDTGASVTIAKPDIAARLPERNLRAPYVLQMASDRPGNKNVCAGEDQQQITRPDKTRSLSLVVQDRSC